MSDLQDQLDRGLEDDSITLDDAAAVQTFALFLSEAPRPPKPYECGPGFIGPLLVERDFAARWLPYMRGETDGPEAPT